jgi:threonine efflux protein
MEDAFAVLATIGLLHWMALVTPGPNVIVISNLAAAQARGPACIAALGVTTVALIWSSLAVLGVNAVFSAHPDLRLAVQVLGGAYLVYLAVRLWRSGGSAPEGAGARLSPLAAYRLGFVTNITNPKSALFFGSVFATALPVDPSTGLLAAAVALAVTNALAWHLFLALAFSHPRVRAAYARRRVAFSRVSGVLIGAFGLRLLYSTMLELRALPGC